MRKSLKKREKFWDFIEQVNRGVRRKVGSNLMLEYERAECLPSLDSLGTFVICFWSGQHYICLH